MTIKSTLVPITALCVGWLSLILAVTVLTDAAPALVVMFPDQDLFDRVSDETSIVSATAVSVTLVSDEESFALSLYKNGAWLVLPSGLRGCSQR